MGCGTCGEVVHGAAGLAKAGLQSLGVPVDAAGAELTRRRLDVCRECPRATRSADPKYAANKGLTSLSTCQECGCLIKPKTMLRSERCPLGKW